MISTIQCSVYTSLRDDSRNSSANPPSATGPRDVIADRIDGLHARLAARLGSDLALEFIEELLALHDRVLSNEAEILHLRAASLGEVIPL